VFITLKNKLIFFMLYFLSVLKLVNWGFWYISPFWHFTFGSFFRFLYPLRYSLLIAKSNLYANTKLRHPAAVSQPTDNKWTVSSWARTHGQMLLANSGCLQCLRLRFVFVQSCHVLVSWSMEWAKVFARCTWLQV